MTLPLHVFSHQLYICPPLIPSFSEGDFPAVKPIAEKLVEAV
jgi:hypothetical protein